MRPDLTQRLAGGQPESADGGSGRRLDKANPTLRNPRPRGIDGKCGLQSLRRRPLADRLSAARCALFSRPLVRRGRMPGVRSGIREPAADRGRNGGVLSRCLLHVVRAPGPCRPLRRRGEVPRFRRRGRQAASPGRRLRQRRLPSFHAVAGLGGRRCRGLLERFSDRGLSGLSVGILVVSGRRAALRRGDRLACWSTSTIPWRISRRPRAC